ncbi:MAG: protein kinase, partial [Muribaculaceae bacterium]|nr:protein kinase [Muribaculaceae bacterium]
MEKVLGAGGFGITYKVERLSDGRVFAMKEYFRKELCERDDNHSISYLKSNRDIIENGLDDFITEARRLDRQNIAHPNIVAIYEVFKANNTAYYVMEFVPGDDLLRYIRKHKDTPLTEQQALSVMRPVLKAVALLHRNRITHLDIKHENIIP